MQTGAFTSYFDVAQATLYAFWIFFVGLILYLRREDRREGYPVVHDRPHRARPATHVSTPRPKKFLLADGSVRMAPRAEPNSEPTNAIPSAAFPGAPLQPVGNPMLAGVGPGSWVERADRPDFTFDEHAPKIVPLRAAPGFHLEPRDPDPRGYAVVAGDRRVAGTVVDAWVDRSEVLIRYLEVEVPGAVAPKRVLVPMPLVVILPRQKQVKVDAILAGQFADAPTTREPEQVTMREEDRISAYFGAGKLYATPGRLGPAL